MTKSNTTTNTTTNTPSTSADRLQLVEECAARYGLSNLSDLDLVANFIGHAPAVELIAKQGWTLEQLRRWALTDLRALPDVTSEQAFNLFTALEIGTRSTRTTTTETLTDAKSVYDYMLPKCESLGVEKVWVILLDRKNHIIRCEEVTSGIATGSLMHAREVFRPAIVARCSAVVIVHNHPSGDPAPSQSDIQMTRQMREASRVIGITLLDHLIVGQKSRDPSHLGYYSFSEAGLL